MLACAVMDRLASFGQAERRVNGNEIGLCLMYRVQDVFIAERNVRVRPQASQEAHARRTTRRTRQVDPDNNKRLAVRHNDLPAASTRPATSWNGR